MPGLLTEEEEPRFKTIEIKKLHPTFAAEVSGVNFDDVSDEQFSEILAAMTKVRRKSINYLPVSSLSCSCLSVRLYTLPLL